MGKDQLGEFVSAGMSTRRIATALGCSQSTVRFWLKKFELKTQPGNVHLCGRCGERDPQKFYGHKRNVCARCHNSYTKSKGHDIRRQVLEHLGGRCVRCGYDEFQVSLDLHHTDPALKDPNFVSMRGWTWSRVLIELQKCVLLCKNCHAALHAGLVSLDSAQAQDSLHGM